MVSGFVCFRLLSDVRRKKCKKEKESWTARNGQMGKKPECKGIEEYSRTKLMSGSGGEAREGGENRRLSITRSERNVGEGGRQRRGKESP